MTKKRVVVAMSGGVDSSVAAALLLREGYDVLGVTMRLWNDDGAENPLRPGCCILGADDARAVCQVLGIPHQVIDFEREFEREVVDYFCRDYQQGRTPNPCLACNDRVKFRTLLARATSMGADYLATGHYARIRRDGEGRFQMLRAVDETKDQSYALFTVGQPELARLLFPVGEHRKVEVRRLASKFGLPVASKRDSFEICFVPDDYRGFVADRVGQQPGEIRDTGGRVVGRHEGIAGYTVGQRHGLGVALGARRYVVAIDRFENAVIIGGEDDLLGDGLLAEELRWVGDTPSGEIAVEAQVRYRAPAVPATVSIVDGRASVRFGKPQKAITPGQAAVFYEGERVLGGGIIEKAIRHRQAVMAGA